jgi:hypothetical protein
LRFWPEIFLSLLLIGVFASRPIPVQANNKTGLQADSTNPYFWISDLNNTIGNWKHYHNYSEIVNTARLLNFTYPNIVNVFSIGQSWQNRSIYCIELTNKGDEVQKPQVLFVGLHHARERISAEIPFYFATLIASNYETNSEVKALLDQCDIFVIPALNVDGLELETTNQWQRKNVHNYGGLNITTPHDVDGDGQVEEYVALNGNVSTWYEGTSQDQRTYQIGVDLNRNYGYQWDSWHYGDILSSGSDIYRGPAPFSEPETQAIRDLALKHNFKYAVSFHSGNECIYYPWAYTVNPTPDDGLFKEVAGNLSKLTGPGVPALQGGKSDPASGEWGDWMYSNRSVYAFTCETFTNMSAWQRKLLRGTEQLPELISYSGVFGYYNPSPSNIERTIRKWLPVFPYIATQALSYTPPTKPAPPPPPPLDQYITIVMTPQLYPSLMAMLAVILTTIRIGTRRKHEFIHA